MSTAAATRPSQQFAGPQFAGRSRQGVRPHQRGEGPLARAIEEQTSKLPSDVFLWASFASMGVSATAYAVGKRHAALFVGQWAAPFLLLGLYNKLVKLEGSE